MRRHGCERLGEAPLDRLRELRAQLLELLQARLQVGALRLELRQPLLLERVLLLGERVHLAELDPPRLEPLDASRQLGAIAVVRRLGVGLVAPPARIGRVGFDPGELDLDLGRSLGCVLGRLAKLDLGTRRARATGHRGHLLA